MRQLDARTRRHLSIDRLEARALLAIGDSVISNIPGNLGLIVHSQVEIAATSSVGDQWQKLSVGGNVTVTTTGSTATPVLESPFISPFNTGRIAYSQLADDLFPQIGIQLAKLHLGNDLSIESSDDTAATSPVGITGAPTNSGRIVHSQVNNGGFGKLGLQLKQVKIRGSLTIRSRIIAGGVDGLPALSASATAATPPIQASLNSGLVKGSQLNNGGFGDTGLQWRGVKVGGSVGIGIEKYGIEPISTTAANTSTAPPVGNQDLPSIDTVNIGSIRDAQFNAGGFGDIGLQWQKVSVRKSVGTSDNNLSVQPEADNLGAITVDGLVFGQDLATPSPTAAASTSTSSSSVEASPTAQTQAQTQPIENDSLNSGRILHSQFNDGGFGDIGAQWLGVAVGGSVSAVHNSLSIQPENHGQGLITVQNIRFPSGVASSSTPIVQAHLAHAAKSRPRIVERDGKAVALKLSPPTSPNSTRYLVDEATNSGTVLKSQVNDGGFGDIGMQWMNVKVGQDVNVVHNSLAVQSEGTGLAGVVVSNVSFGTPLSTDGTSTANDSADAGTTTPATATALSSTPEVRSIRHSSKVRPLVAFGADNDRFLSHKQHLHGPVPIVLLQWDHVVRSNGLLIVHNTIAVPDDGSVKLDDIHFLEGTPTATLVTAAQFRRLTADEDASAAAGATSTSGVSADASTTGGQIKSSATNSGIIRRNQFSDGGFGDIGLQWRNVKVSGSVSVVHNNLSVSVTDGETGPITVSNVTFNSGALDNAKASDLKVLAPPSYIGQIHVKSDAGRPLQHNPAIFDTATNSGILWGGQFQVGGNAPSHVKLQWRGVSIHGSVAIVDNFLSVPKPPAGNGLITIQHVTFG